MATDRMSSIQTGMTDVNSSSGNSSNVRRTEGATNPQPRTSPLLQNPDSFWTLCRKCKMHFEYSKEYHNRNLWCHNCQGSFLAIEVPRPRLKAGTLPKPWISPQHKQGVNNATADVHKRQINVAKPELRNRLIEKARVDILKKLNEGKRAASVKSAPKEDKQNQAAIHAAEISAVSATQLDVEAIDFVSMEVPDADFHDFDMDRTAESFSDNQVWAVYDAEDGMPRSYAFVHGIISREPFEVRISWLKSKTNHELGTLHWVDSGYSKTCGDFRAGKPEIRKTLNTFSHIVKWRKGAKGLVHIFPQKGEIWALYRNWSPNWDQFTPKEVVHMYEMVEVLEDYNQHEGVLVIPLAKVAGFKSVFTLQTDSSRRIMTEEMFRFSHQVPCYLLTGQESPSAPQGCRELDPAAMPLELLQVQEDTVAVDVKKAEKPADIGSSESENAVAGVFANTGSSVDVNIRFKEPILTYERRRKGKKMA